jgi:hypothetical protein
MTELEVHRWESRDGVLTEAALHLRYLPSWSYRISINEYEPGVKVWVLTPEFRMTPRQTI